MTSGQKGIAARRVVAQVLHSLSKLGDALGGILPTQVYVQAAGQVLQHVLQTIIGRPVTNQNLMCCDMTSYSHGSVQAKGSRVQAKGSSVSCRPHRSGKQQLILREFLSCGRKRRVKKTCSVEVYSVAFFLAIFFTFSPN